MLISDGWFLRPVTMTIIDSCGQAESVMGGLWYRKILSEIREFRFSGPTIALLLPFGIVRQGAPESTCRAGPVIIRRAGKGHRVDLRL